MYTKARWAETGGGARIKIAVRPRANSRATCAGCGHTAPGYDSLGERHFDYVPLPGMAVVLVYAELRVRCRACGVRAKKVPWAAGKRQMTWSYLWFLARWARRLSWSEVARSFGTN